MALKGIQVLELAGLAPVPFCGMILADFGASVIRIDKLPSGMNVDCLGNGKRSIQINLKSPHGANILKKLASQSDVLIEPFRPGVMEKLGLGPDTLMALNKKLIYARLSGYGQIGPLSHKAGHDINYLSQAGVLSMFKHPSEKLYPPVNVLGDFAGGGLMCALGITAALFERSRSGLGQVIDSDITSGTAYVASWLFRSKNLPGLWTGPPGTNILDGGAHFYGCYETKDGRYMAVGSIEPQFYELFLQGLGVDSNYLPQYDISDKSKAKVEEIFKTQTQEHWIKVFKDLDACVTPVLDAEETAAVNSKVLTNCAGVYAPTPAPGLSRTPAQSQATKPLPSEGEHTMEILRELGYSQKDIDEFITDGVIASSSKL